MGIKTVPVHPATLRWAREDIGLPLAEAAKKLSKSIEEITAWESGEKSIGLSNARKLADRYKISLPVLYLKNIPEEWQQEKPKDFRRPETQEPYSYPLCSAIRDARERQAWMREYLKSENEKPLDWLGSFSGKKNIKHIADWIVQWLDIDRQKIAALKNDTQALSHWIEKIEAKRIIVSANDTHAAHKIDHSEYSGLVLYDNYSPLILLNPADSPARRVFTLVHELAHLLLDDSSSVSQINFRQEATNYDPIETMCNRVASRVLINDGYIQTQWNDSDNPETTIQALASNLKISHSAIAVKLKALGFIDQAMLDMLLDQYKRLYLKGLENRPSGGRTVPDKQVLDRCGKLLTQTVLTAYEQGSVNATEIYDILGLKLKYLSKLSDRLQFPLHRWVS